MEAIILTPADPDISNVDYVAWVRSERDILADDTAAAGGQLVVATAFVWGASTVRALMLCRSLDTSASAFAVGCDLAEQLRGEVQTFVENSLFGWLACSQSGGNPLACSFELTLGRQVLIRSDADGAVVLPSTTD